MQISPACLRAIATATTLSFSTAVTHSAKAAAPPAGTEAYQELSPYSTDIKEMKQPGSTAGCCDLSDCRRVRAYVNSDGHYMVLIPHSNKETGQGFEGGDDTYHEVPDTVIVAPDQRPVIPFNLACWTKPFNPYLIGRNGFYCFTPELLTEQNSPHRVLFSERRK